MWARLYQPVREGWGYGSAGITCLACARPQVRSPAARQKQTDWAIAEVNGNGLGLKEKWFYLLLFCLKMEEMWLYVYTTGKVWQHRGEIRDQGRRREWDPLRRLARVTWASWRQKAKGKTVKREKTQGSTEHHPGILHVNQTFCCCCCCSRKFTGSFLRSRHCSEVCDTILWDFIKKKKQLSKLYRGGNLGTQLLRWFQIW